ncbi:MAG: hypothetical protein K8I82_11270, partial [Anaerolineae bacterium]|nr:hypothetical protein [Anaerolineae bacterium]
MNALLILLGLMLGTSAAGVMIASFRARRSAAPFRYAGIGLGIASLILIFIGASLVSVAPNERMVIFNRVSGELGEPRGPGVRLVNPLTTSYKIYDVSRQTYTMNTGIMEEEIPSDRMIPARTSDGQEVFIDITLIYNIDPDNINQLHQKWPNERYQTELVSPLLRSVVRDVVSEFPVESVYQ